MELIIFGVGDIYNRFKGKISKEDKVIAALDNNMLLQGKNVDGIMVYHPMKICELKYDKVIIMSNYASEMKHQLFMLGVPKEKIQHYKEFFCEQKSGKCEIFCSNKKSFQEKKCLIITSSLGYHGGAIVAAYTAMALNLKGYNVVIAAPDGDRHFIEEFNKKGIDFILYNNLQFAIADELDWIREYDSIIVNTYPMILCALEIIKFRKVILWLHESEFSLGMMSFWKDRIETYISNENLIIYAVSKVAKDNFTKYVSNATCKVKILPFGIPDERSTIPIMKNQKMKFAVVGSIIPIKQQLLFLEAVMMLEPQYKGKSEFFIIGKNGDPDYSKQVSKLAMTLPNVYVTGELSRVEVEDVYKVMDVLVIPSTQEPMSIVAVEAMMHEKICIVSNAAGIYEYITPEYNGLVCQAGDIHSLIKQMIYCFENKDELNSIRKNARKLYEENFKLDVFGSRWENALLTEG